MSTPKATRWLDLVAFLMSRGYPATREEIFDRVTGYRDPGTAGGEEESRDRETRRRKFERDKDELRALGIEIETVDLPGAAHDEPNKAYRLAERNFYLPYLELTPAAESHRPQRPYRGLQRVPVTDGDLAVLDRVTQRLAQRSESPLGHAAASVRRKLAFDLPLPRAQIERLLARSLDGDAERALELLQHAVAKSVAIACQYYAIGRNSTERREIEPYGLFLNWGRWYCVGRARERNDIRVFRVDRLRDVRHLRGNTASFTMPADFDIHRYLHRAPWELSAGKPTVVHVVFAFPASRWVQNQRVGRVVDPMLDDGGARLAFDVTDMNPFLRWLLTFRSDVTAVEPDSVAKQLAELRRRVAALYEGDR